MSLLNQTQVKRFILRKFESLRPGMQINRVSADALDFYEAHLRAMIIEDVKRHPTRGQTFKELISASTR